MPLQNTEEKTLSVRLFILVLIIFLGIGFLLFFTGWNKKTDTEIDKPTFSPEPRDFPFDLR